MSELKVNDFDGTWESHDCYTEPCKYCEKEDCECN